MYKWKKIKKMPKRRLAIDFDGVLHKYSKGFHDGTLYDMPVKDAKKFMEKLHKDWWLYVYTTRASTKRGIKAIEEWLRTHKIPFDEVVGHKPIAFAYIDDRAIYFQNWQQAIEELNIRDKDRLKSKE